MVVNGVEFYLGSGYVNGGCFSLLIFIVLCVFYFRFASL